MSIPTQFSQIDTNHFLSFFDNFSGQTGWLIKINGKPVKLNSGKSLWKTLSHAKSALKNHIGDFSNAECFIRRLNIKYLENEYSPNDAVLWKNFLAFAQEKGILEFVELK